MDREPRGVLRAGREAERFCEQLTRDLEAVVDDRTGSPLVVAVERTDSMYAGPRRDSLPDLLVKWNDAVVGTLAHADGNDSTVRARSEKIGIVEKQNSNQRTGDHHPNGLYAFTGPGIPAVRAGSLCGSWTSTQRSVGCWVSRRPTWTAM